jgi:hypothetical protein
MEVEAVIFEKSGRYLLASAAYGVLKDFRLPNQAFQKSRFFGTVDSCNNFAFLGAPKNND